MPTGEWQQPFPTCTGLKANGKNKRKKLNKNQFNITEVQCDNPAGPGKKLENMYAQGSPPYKAGDVIQFNCNPEYMMQGQPIIACQDSGRWSGVLPKCTYAIHLTNFETIFKKINLKKTYFFLSYFYQKVSKLARIQVNKT